MQHSCRKQEPGTWSSQALQFNSALVELLWKGKLGSRNSTNHRGKMIVTRKAFEQVVLNKSQVIWLK